MRSCYLQGTGPCTENKSGEHYISETVLKALGSNGEVQIANFPWQPSREFKAFPIKSLTANILCKGHNEGLSELDSTAGELFRTLRAMAESPMSNRELIQFDGLKLEMWFAKVVCGLTAAFQ